MAPNTVDQHRHSQTRKYNRASSVVFLKTREAFGGLSNMAGGFPLRVNEIRILTSEALYQACRFPHLADVQRLIIGQKSPMAAKMKSKLYRHQSRPDWNRVRVSIMRWCLRVKLAQNWDSFSKLLLQTGDSPIVEQSRRDDFWGALPVGEQTLVGMNVLGRLLMELRESIQTEVWSKRLRVEPLPIRYFLLGGRPIESVAARELGRRESVAEPDVRSRQPHTTKTIAEQLPLLGTLKADVPPRHEDTPTSAAAERYEHLTPYPAYKDSGAPWLGEVPVHWEVQRLRNVAGMRVSNVDKHAKEGETSVRLCNYVDVYKNDYISKQMGFMKATANNEEIERFRLERDDVLITKDSETWDDIGVPALVTEPAPDLISGYHLALLRPRSDKVAGAYLLRALQSKGLAYQFHIEAKGVTRYGLSHASIKSVWLSLPPLPEQTAIVRFLDYADRRIRRYIRAKQKLIALLEEQKQALIHQAVTGQIDVRTSQPYPSYKPSGVEWLGDVPAHWEVIRLKFVAAELVDCLHETPKYSENGEFPAIRTADISPGILHLSSARRIEADEYARWIERLEPKPGDILYSREGERFGIAACVPDGVRLCISQRMMVFRIRPEHNPVFVMWLLNSKQVYAQACQDIMGATAPHVNVSTIRNYFLALPARDEQDSLVDKIENSTKGFSSAISNTEGEISFLREYRARLIADVVTGKLDVREAAATLPEVDPLVAEDTLGDALNPDVESALDELATVPEEAEA